MVGDYNTVLSMSMDRKVNRTSNYNPLALRDYEYYGHIGVYSQMQYPTQVHFGAYSVPNLMIPLGHIPRDYNINFHS